jgi:hypothetical protein
MGWGAGALVMWAKQPGRLRVGWARCNKDVYVTYCYCIPIWVGWLVWTSCWQDREASLITQYHNQSITAIGYYGLRSESGHQGRNKRTARIGAVTADIVNRFYSATFERISDHRESFEPRAQQ